MVLKIPLDLNEQSSADKKGFGRVTVETFDVDFLVPPTLHDAGDSHRVVTITLVDLHLQNCLCIIVITDSLNCRIDRNCVEVAGNLPRMVALRDSKHPDGAALVVTPEEWGSFVAGVKAGRFDLR